MKIPRYFIAAAACAAALLLQLLPGCTTTTTITPGANGGPNVTNTITSLDVPATCAIITAVGTPLMPIAVAKCPECKVWFSVAAGILTAQLANGQVDPAVIQTALNAAKVPAADIPEVTAVTESLLGLYQAYAQKVIAAKLDKTTYLVPVLTTIRNLLAVGAGLQVPGPAQ